jgi:hypothetical protein
MNMAHQFTTNCPGSLFWNGGLLELIQEQVGDLCREVGGYSRELILGCAVDEVADSLASKYALNPVRLHRDRIEIIHHGRTTIDHQNRTCLVVYDPGFSRDSAATTYKFAVPFEGDPRLFLRRPRDFEMELPWGEIVGTELHIICKTTSRDRDTIRARVDENLSKIERLLHRANKEVEQPNKRLRGLALERLQRRKEQFTRDIALAESLGFPIRKRPDAPETYKVPVQRKKIPVFASVGPRQALTLDPYIDSHAYEDILRSISSMARVLELSPKAFAKMGEEALRFVFLVPLNIQYEGQATGETFNCDGKTDIIVKVGGRNVFIAECLIWDGPQYFKSKIDQLLGYTSWRDTKTAMIVFNRKRNLSAVLEQIPALVMGHVNCKRRDTSFAHETGFRFVLHQKDDKNRELTLTVVVFEVPE